MSLLVPIVPHWLVAANHGLARDRPRSKRRGQAGLWSVPPLVEPLVETEAGRDHRPLTAGHGGFSLADAGRRARLANRTHGPRGHREAGRGDN